MINGCLRGCYGHSTKDVSVWLVLYVNTYIYDSIQNFQPNADLTYELFDIFMFVI